MQIVENDSVAFAKDPLTIINATTVRPLTLSKKFTACKVTLGFFSTLLPLLSFCFHASIQELASLRSGNVCAPLLIIAIHGLLVFEIPHIYLTLLCTLRYHFSSSCIFLLFVFFHPPALALYFAHVILSYLHRQEGLSIIDICYYCCWLGMCDGVRK